MSIPGIQTAEPWRIRKGSPSLILAPMEGVTDAPMRALLSEIGGFSFCVSEFLRISQELPPPKVFHAHVPELAKGSVTPAGLHVQFQLLGGNPELLAEAAWRACQAGACGIDLNFGCPAPIVNRHDGGAALLKYPERIRKIVEAVRQRVPKAIPVSVKLRLGWDSIDSIHRNAEEAAAGGADWLTIHGRTKVQGYTPPAYWKPIGEVQKRLGIAVVANGEIWSLEEFRRCRDETGCEHFMLGRSALADPYLARRLLKEIGQSEEEVIDESELMLSRTWVKLLKRFSEVSATYSDHPHYLCKRTKQWLKLASHRKPLPWFDQVKRLGEFSEILSYLETH